MKQRRSGLSLVEVLVASGVLVVTLLPLFILFSRSIRTTEISIDELVAVSLATELMDQMRLLAYEPGFDRLVNNPVPNPAPDFPNWVDIGNPESGFHQRGRALEHPMNFGAARLATVDSDDWKALGAPAARDASTFPDPWVESRSRVYLSPSPSGYRRLVKVYQPRLDLQERRTSGLKRIEVRVEWDRTFMGSPITQTRAVHLATLVGDPGRRGP